MYKEIMLLLLLFLLTGCSAEYNITFDKYLEIEEEIKFLEANDIIIKGYNSVEDAISANLNNQFNTPEYKLYEKEQLIGSHVSGIKLLKNYNSICSLKGKTYFSSFFSDCIFEESEGKVTINLILAENHFYNEKSPTISNLDSVNINIYSPYLVINGNYSDYDREKDIMKWIFDNENYGDISFQIDTNYTNENIVVENSIFSEPKTFNPIYILIGIFVIILVGITYIYIAYQKNNRI